MANFKEVFQHKRVVLPVVHVQNTEQALNNLRIAHEEGCDGAFLINMQNPLTLDRMSHEELLKIHHLAKKEFATWWLGINYLDLPTVKIFENADSSVSGLWADNAQIYEWLDKQLEAEEIKKAKIKSGWKGLYFGGVAFKYQREVDNPALAAKIATAYVDVVTTSGKATGSAPDIAKIEVMKKAMGDNPLAIASGVSPENVKEFIPFADCFIVATSLLVPDTENFDRSKVRELMEKIRSNE